MQKGYIIRSLARSYSNMQALELAGVEAFPGDLLEQATAQRLPEMIRGCNAVIHIATATPRDIDAPGAWDKMARLRTEGTRSLLDASVATGVQHYLQQSVVMAYPDSGDQWLDEHTPLDTSPTRTTFCKPVIAMEDMLRAIPAEQLRWCILRGGFFVGPETVQDILLAQLRSSHLTVPCDGRNYISPVNIHDMATAIVAALESAPASSTFNIVDEPIRYGEYVDRLADLLGVAHVRRDGTLRCLPSFRCSNEAARRVLGWVPGCGIWPGADVLAE